MLKRKNLLFVFVVFAFSVLLSNDAMAVTLKDVEDDVVSDVVWDDVNVTYSLTKDIRVKYGTTLTISDGVKVEGNGHAIYVCGTLKANDVEFTNVAIGVGNTDYNPCTIEMSNSIVSEGSFLYKHETESTAANITIKNNTFKNLTGNISIWYPGRDIYIEKNVFEKCGGIYVGSKNNVYITNNVFHGMKTAYSICNWAQYSSECYVSKNSFYDTGVCLKLKYSNSSMVATNNYWNTLDEEVIKGRIIDGNTDFSISKTIDYSDFLIVPDEATPVISHEYTVLSRQEPTCVNKGVVVYKCTLCADEKNEELEVDANNHAGGTEIRGKVEETCENEGYTGDTYCKGCNKKIATGHSVEKKEHDYANPVFKWSDDGKSCKVTYTCKNDSNHIAEYDATVTSKVKTEATCMAKGVTTYTAKYGSDTESKDVQDIKVDANNHAGGTEIRGKVEETCENEGYTGDTYCKGCNKKIATGHSVEKKEHDYANPVFKWSDDGKSCKVTYTCGNDSNHIAEYDATVTSEVKTEATCTAKGTTTYTATYGNGEAKIIDTKDMQDIEINPNNHVGGTEVRNYKDATSVNDGYSGDIVCKGCDKTVLKGRIIKKYSTNYQVSTNTAKDNLLPKLPKVNGVNLKTKKKRIIVKWKAKKGVECYQISISSSKKFKKCKKYLTTITSKTIKKLKSKKKYYVRVRAGKIVGNRMIYGKWSIIKKIKVK